MYVFLDNSWAKNLIVWTRLFRATSMSSSLLNNSSNVPSLCLMPWAFGSQISTTYSLFPFLCQSLKPQRPADSSKNSSKDHWTPSECCAKSVSTKSEHVDDPATFLRATCVWSGKEREMFCEALNTLPPADFACPMRGSTLMTRSQLIAQNFGLL